MKLQLNEVKFASQWDAEELGSLRSNLEKGDKVKFAKIKADKQVTVLITEKGEESPNKQVVCSKGVSATIKKAIEKGTKATSILKAILELRVIKNDTGHFLVAPTGEMGESFTVEEITKAETVDYQELVAF